jgi:hypothetical protein
MDTPNELPWLHDRYFENPSLSGSVGHCFIGLVTCQNLSCRCLDELKSASKKLDNRKISPVASFIQHGRLALSFERGTKARHVESKTNQKV